MSISRGETSQGGTLYRLAAFAASGAGGNPAGVWVGDALPDADVMQAIAADVGYSETAFVAPQTGLTRDIRYYSPIAEVSFCGHATIAAGATLGAAGGDATFHLQTSIGEVPVAVQTTAEGVRVSLTSVETRQRAAEPSFLDAVLSTLGWSRDELDETLPPAVAFAGAWHLVLAAATRDRLDQLDYDFDALKTLMETEDLTTLQLVWRESETVYHARNPFPVGGVVEDPATGAAAAALGGYLRDAGLVAAPASINIRQGEAMGRPSRLQVDIPTAGGIAVSGYVAAVSDSVAG